MLLAVTPNPPLDRTLNVAHLTVGAVHRATRVFQAAGGKGMNVSRVARRLDYPVLATGPLAGRTGQTYADLAKAEGITGDWYWLAAGETRTCLLINHDRGDTTLINEPGPAVSSDDWLGFADHVKQLAGAAEAVVLSGSMPSGLEAGVLGDLARALATPDRAVYLDTSGPVLTAAVARPQGLCIKVNRTELADALAQNLAELPALIEAGQELLNRGAALVVVTLGAQGAVAITGKKIWQAAAPPVEVVSSVGSGDSFLAGLVVARLRGERLDQALTLAVACGAANTQTPLPGHFDLAALNSLAAQVSLTQIKGPR